jgi:2-C-methyl-D-erythritol 2,4-cyclodiphosphate synthase
MAEAVLKMREGKALPSIRIGQGYDVHPLVAGRKLILCGVEIPHETGLLGHSDADVALHALMDAMLGALALGDIGKHFPDTDPNYKGISSLLLLTHVASLVKERGFKTGNVDMTIVAQRPKLAPYITAMRENVAKVLEAPLDSVNIKATTTEHLGFEGEEKGISAQAVCLLIRC